MPNIFLQNDPIDKSFIGYKHPSTSKHCSFFLQKYPWKYLGIIPDRSNTTDSSGNDGSKLPEFTDVKMFVDALLVKYQTDHQFNFELERNLMTCTPFHNDYFYSKIKPFINLSICYCIFSCIKFC